VLRRKQRTAAPITAILPRVKVVSLGGKLRPIAELRLIDLAELQAWIEEQVPSPLAGLPEPGDPERDAALRRTWIPAREWPPKLGTDEASGIINQPEGLIAFVLVALRRGDPSVTPQDAAECAVKMAPEEWMTLRRIAWGVSPWREVRGELVSEDEIGPPIDWVEAFAQMAEVYGFTPETVGNLTLSQWRGYRAGKADVYRGLDRQPGESVKELRERERRLFGVNPPGDTSTESVLSFPSGDRP
jgi:hypothetical protein